ncbi:MAG: DUF4054 domain-containing protein, partial [Gemmatimonadota bacterium]
MDPAAVQALVVVVAPEFGAADPDRIEAIVELAIGRLDADVFGDRGTEAAAYLAAHLLTMSERGGRGGQIVSESEGDLSRSYGAVQPGVGQSSDALAATSYGQEF